MTNIRNFVIIAHIDHGKSTLADRFLEITNTISKSKLENQFLDKMSLEKEKGITIKMHPCQMKYKLNDQEYILNLIDTPGHADFNYEVSRALKAVEGAILLVDVTQGVQAQTLANLYLAQKQGLKIIGCLNKIDLTSFNRDEIKKDVSKILNIEEKDIFMVSAKTGEGVDELLKKVIEYVEPPKMAVDKPLRALIFDSKFDSYRGVLAYVRVFDGEVNANDDIYLLMQKEKSKVIECGIFKPDLVVTNNLKSGEIGWIATGLKDPGVVKVGDTITLKKYVDDNHNIEALAGYKEPQPMVFSGFYPESNDEFELFAKSLAKLKLNDASFSYEPEANEALGRGFRLGFLGILHYEIITLRLQREYGLNLITTIPMVPYKIILLNGEEIFVKKPTDFPENNQIKLIKEPYVELKILAPSKYLNSIISLMPNFRAAQTHLETLQSDLILITYELPLSELILDLYDSLKSASQGFASMIYEIMDYRETDVQKLDVLIHHEKEESLSFIVPTERVDREAKKLTAKLKEIIPPQNFALAIQVARDGLIISRETIPALKKDVTGYLYGGDRTRKMKLWKKQQRGKKRLASIGTVNIPPEVYHKLFLNKKD